MGDYLFTLSYRLYVPVWMTNIGYELCMFSAQNVYTTDCFLNNLYFIIFL